MDISPVRR